MVSCLFDKTGRDPVRSLVHFCIPSGLPTILLKSNEILSGINAQVEAVATRLITSKAPLSPVINVANVLHEAASYEH